MLKGDEGMAEALAGYPSIREHGLPMLRKYIARGASVNDAGMLTLLELIARAEDPNVYRRAGLSGRKEISAEAAELLRRGADMDDIGAFFARVDAGNASRGGCADLLAIVFSTFFRYSITEGDAL